MSTQTLRPCHVQRLAAQQLLFSRFRSGDISLQLTHTCARSLSRRKPHRSDLLDLSWRGLWDECGRRAARFALSQRPPAIDANCAITGTPEPQSSCNEFLLIRGGVSAMNRMLLQVFILVAPLSFAFLPNPSYRTSTLLYLEGV